MQKKAAVLCFETKRDFPNCSFLQLKKIHQLRGSVSQPLRRLEMRPLVANGHPSSPRVPWTVKIHHHITKIHQNPNISKNTPSQEVEENRYIQCVTVRRYNAKKTSQFFVDMLNKSYWSAACILARTLKSKSKHVWSLCVCELAGDWRAVFRSYSTH